MKDLQKKPFNPNEHLIQLKSREGSKDYLPVQFRIVWFREAYPQGTIDTEELCVDLDREVEEEVYVWNNEKRRSEKVVKHAKGYARYRAVVTDGMGGRATGTKSENAASFPDFCEKAETGSIGRALAGLGYGTQFAPELNELPRIVDSPVERAGGNSETSQNGTAAHHPSSPTPITASSTAQSKPVLDMIVRAKVRTERMQLLWDDIKRDTFGGQCPPDDTLTVQQVAQINGVLTVVEKGAKSA